MNGASEAYPLLARHAAGRRVHVPSPTLGEYERAFPQAERYDDDLNAGVDLTLLAARVGSGDLVVIVNPNNPTGTTLASDALVAFARERPDVLVLIDESFIDFTTMTSVIALLEKDGPAAPANVIVLKSLSKCWGMPGLRLGFMWSTNAPWQTRVDNELPIWNVNALAERVIELVLKHKDALASSFVQSRADRDAFVLGLRQLARDRPGLVVDEGGGNFVVLRVGSAALATRVTERLLQEACIWVKDLAPKVAGGALRLAVRTPAENARLVDTLATILDEEARS